MVGEAEEVIEGEKVVKCKKRKKQGDLWFVCRLSPLVLSDAACVQCSMIVSLRALMSMLRIVRSLIIRKR